MATVLAVMSAALTGCSDDDDNTPGGGSSSESSTYTIDKPSAFPKTLMVASISKGRKKEGSSWTPSIVYTFTYDADNLPSQFREEWGSGGWKAVDYKWDGDSCRLTETSFGTSKPSSYKGFFKDNLLVKAKWDGYTVTSVSFDEQGRLVRGSNRYTLTWDSEGNITRYSDGNQVYTYTNLPNRANVDFNLFLESCCLEDAWDDDGSQYFAYFGWTGVRTANLMESITRYGDESSEYGDRNITYTTDALNRVVAIDLENYTSTNVYYPHYEITYLAD